MKSNQQPLVYQLHFASRTELQSHTSLYWEKINSRSARARPMSSIPLLLSDFIIYDGIFLWVIYSSVFFLGFPPLPTLIVGIKSSRRPIEAIMIRLFMYAIGGYNITIRLDGASSGGPTRSNTTPEMHPSHWYMRTALKNPVHLGEFWSHLLCAGAPRRASSSLSCSNNTPAWSALPRSINRTPVTRIFPYHALIVNGLRMSSVYWRTVWKPHCKVPLDGPRWTAGTTRRARGMAMWRRRAVPSVSPTWVSAWWGACWRGIASSRASASTSSRIIRRPGAPGKRRPGYAAIGNCFTRSTIWSRWVSTLGISRRCWRWVCASSRLAAFSMNAAWLRRVTWTWRRRAASCATGNCVCPIWRTVCFSWTQPKSAVYM